MQQQNKELSFIYIGNYRVLSKFEAEKIRNKKSRVKRIVEIGLNGEIQ